MREFRKGRVKNLIATPLFVVLLIVESTDDMFAVDSIPAIIAITRDPFIVYTSNIFAILGLRALYFAIAGFESTANITSVLSTIKRPTKSGVAIRILPCLMKNLPST